MVPSPFRWVEEVEENQITELSRALKEMMRQEILNSKQV
jgi:hypothetical protein